MDLMMINLSHDQCMGYIEEIMKSNLPKMIQFELEDLLKTALTQADQARAMGWLPED